MVMAALAVLRIVGMAQPGAVPVWRLHGMSSTPPSPGPGPPEEQASFPERQLHYSLELLRHSPRNVGRLRFVTANRRGMEWDP